MIWRLLKLYLRAEDISIRFLCVISQLKKDWKGLYALAYNKDAPKTHNLNYLVEKISEHIDIDLSDELDEFLKFLNEKSIPTRYPEDLKIILKDFKKTNTNKILKQTKDLLEWLRLKFKS